MSEVRPALDVPERSLASQPRPVAKETTRAAAGPLGGLRRAKWTGTQHGVRCGSGLGDRVIARSGEGATPQDDQGALFALKLVSRVPQGSASLRRRKTGVSVSVAVFVVEDQQVLRETLVDYLRIQADIEVSGFAESVEGASKALKNLGPVLVLLDLSLGERSGFDLLEEVVREGRHRCLIVSGHAESSYVRRGLTAGARGYVLKGNAKEIPDAIRTVMAGRIFVSAALDDTLSAKLSEVVNSRRALSPLPLSPSSSRP